MSNKVTMHGIEWDVVHTYTRAQAIEDGVLADVSDVAKEAGIRYPLAVTSALRDGWITPPDEMREYGQNECGRLWDVLMVFRFAAKGSDGDTVFFPVSFAQLPDKGPETVKLKAVCGPGDNAEPVISIMLEHED